MGKTLTGLIATGSATVSFLCILVAFSTPHWLETDYRLQNPKFQKIGLWIVCFYDFQEPHYWYDTVFGNCWWIFEEEFYILFDFLLPGFFVAVQFFFTICFTMHLFAGSLTLLYLGCSRDNYRFIKLLTYLGGSLIVAVYDFPVHPRDKWHACIFCGSTLTLPFFGTIAVYLFGLYGDGRDWLPNWEHNNIGWSYALAVIGVIGSYASGTLFLIEARRHRIKRLKEENLHTAFQMDPLKSSH